ncbi:DUF1559 family PulG-like putative transporter [Stieleria varia]|uniref:DUF1559 domain-containing protein n=1 Tax=Stieleria varia TaxID=2528005 RepID=A0A5C6AZM2_9BACT|nr:DUF1559 domain-containing protein [Stieleria varia]TWU04967.1 hypothetical protein Pla52n_30120 [Stieleria varia]
MRWILTAPLFLCVFLSFAFSGYRCDAQQMLSTRFLPSDALAMIEIKPAELMTMPETELYPREVAETWVDETLGVSLQQCERIRLVVAAPAMGPPMMAAVVVMKEPVSINDIAQHVMGEANERKVGNYECLDVGGGAVLYQHNPKVIVVSSEGYLPPVLRAAGGNDAGALGQIVSQTPDVGQVNVVVGIAVVRPIINGTVQMMQQMIPPQVQNLTEIPNLLESLKIQVDASAPKEGLRITLNTANENNASELAGILNDAMNLAQQIGLAQFAAEMQLEDEIGDATLEYAQRVSTMFKDLITPEQNGQDLVYKISGNNTVPYQVAMVAIMLPAVQSARVAAKTMGERNQMKQILLAMHNYHDAYGRLPAAIHRDADGKPLLSWRVHILPFIEEQALYEQFHLDEAWDSPHNIALLPQMPEVYRDITGETDAPTTVFHVPVGEGLMFSEMGDSRFRDVLDGLSNTIMLIRTTPEHAVEWTKPSDVEIHLEHPFTSLMFANGVASVGMGDGAVLEMREGIDTGDAKSMFTRAAAD